MCEKLIELLMDLPVPHLTYEQMEKYSEDVADYLIENGVTIKNAEECTASLDYESEYNKLLEAHKRLCGDYAELKRDYESMETEFIRMRAQLDIVYLIFGGVSDNVCK